MEEFVHCFQGFRVYSSPVMISYCVDPFIEHRREKVLLWRHVVRAQASYLLTRRNQGAVSDHSAQEQVVTNCFIISLI